MNDCFLQNEDVACLLVTADESQLSPDVSTAVRLLERYAAGDELPDGAIAGEESWREAAAEDLIAADEQIEDLLEKLQGRDQPYAIIYHVHGYRRIRLRHNHESRETAMRALASFLAIKVQEMGTLSAAATDAGPLLA